MTRVLLADDSPDMLAATATALRHVGYEVTCAGNGADAICRLAEFPAYDLLLLDMVMPGWNGPEVLRHLPPHAPPVIVISGAEVLESDILDTGKVKRVMSKGMFELPDLLRAMAEVLAESAAGGTS